LWHLDSVLGLSFNTYWMPILLRTDRVSSNDLMTDMVLDQRLDKIEDHEMGRGWNMEAKETKSFRTSCAWCLEVQIWTLPTEPACLRPSTGLGLNELNNQCHSIRQLTETDNGRDIMHGMAPILSGDS
jgi:hypothetical protein